MAQAAYDLLVRIEASTEALRRELNSGANSVNGFRASVERNLGGIDKSVGRISGAFSGLKGVLATVGISVSVNAFKNMALTAIKTAGDLGDLATQLGITTETLQTLNFAGSQFGVSQDEIAVGVQRLSKAIGDAAEGSKTAIDGFERLGVKILDVNGKVRSTDAIFREVIQAISEIEDPAVRAATGADLMGRGFQKLLPIVNEGAAGFEEMRRQAEEMGIILDEQLIANADEASDKLATMSQIISANLTQALVTLAPLLTSAAEGIASLVKSFNEMVIKEDTVGQLRVLNNEIKRYEEELSDINEGNLAGTVQEAFGRDADWVLEQLSNAIKKRNELVQSMFSDPSRGAGVVETTEEGTGVRNPPPKITTTTVKSEAEKAAERLQDEIDNIRTKIAALNAEESNNTFGKLLAESLGRLNLTMDESNPKLAELRGEIETLAAAEDEAAIAQEALTAVQQADAEAVREYEEQQKAATEALDGARTALEVYNDTLAEYGVLLDKGFINQEQFNRLAKQAGEDFVAADENAQRLIQSAGQLGEGFVRAFGRIGTSINSTKELLAELVGVLADVLANLAGGGIETLIGNALQIGVQSATMPGGGLQPGGPQTPWLQPRARGGRVIPGMGYFVGERGPEPFIPDVPGTILPNSMAGALGGGGVTINQNIVLQTNGGGSPAQNRDLSEKASDAFRRGVRQEIEGVIALHMRDRGLFRPNVV